MPQPPPTAAPPPDRRRAAWLLLGLALALALPLVAYRWLTAPRPVRQATDPPGLKIFRAQQCDHCHSLQGVADGKIGVSLDGIGQRAGTRLPGVSGPDYLHRKILHPEVWRATDQLNAMPSFEGKLSPAELDTLVNWLMTR